MIKKFYQQTREARLNMAKERVTVDGYSIVRIGTPFKYRFEVWRDYGLYAEPIKPFNYFIEAASYLADEKGLEGDVKTGFCEVLCQIYSNGE